MIEAKKVASANLLALELSLGLVSSKSELKPKKGERRARAGSYLSARDSWYERY